MYSGALLLLIIACRPGKTVVEVEDTASEDLVEWEDSDTEETDTEDSDAEETDTEVDSDETDTEDKPEDTGEKPDSDEYQDCSSDFDPEQPCEGSWEETICLYEGLLWWCENGRWMNEDDKPD